MMAQTEVLVVGAGPTGLLLAGDLASHGIDCTVIEQRHEESNLTRAFAVHARTLELLDAREIADQLVATGVEVDQLSVLFESLVVDLSTLPSRFPFLLVTPQYETERLLTRRAVRLGATIRRGLRMTGLHQDANSVEVDLLDRNGVTTNHRARWLIGTDGVHSTVRGALRLPFPGKTVVSSVVLADVWLSDPPEEELTFDRGSAGFFFAVPFGDGWYRVIAWSRDRQLPEDAPVDLEELHDVLIRVGGTDFGLTEARWLSRFHSDERQVPRYRVGRVFLAGDAAHVHSPAGGLGMNVGLQDAANLGWRLAAAIKGHAPPRQLDGYHAERHPVGRAALRASGALLRLAIAETPFWQRANWVIETASRVARVPDRVVQQISGIGLHYQRSFGAHRLTGTRSPDDSLTVGGAPTRVYAALRNGRFLLILPPESSHAPMEAWRDRVTLGTGTERGMTARLIRPDGYIAWAGDRPDAGEVRAALARWCGPAKHKSQAKRNAHV
ncbi:FAD-dependent monooxygenase [Microlunatus parietis]|uniref:2-polyprenyl-6-methoxyphenol hydroxylase-like FAD-dependent oxidoreductase n=1 Tax=Microlunatus parietis TaxID=682979 RepID=A0A7Y9I705_9ACTN|nr:FAD-dependent monooxygenase [Microlunatus parietis]NYE71288.1 2-polyprenyl-6-methoxyphenol hydroxylase-like FAD-dependent oxidoreductase [Microlunatus parietis]